MGKTNKESDTFLLFVGYCTDEASLTDQEKLFQLLEKLPGIIGMNKIRGPMVSTASNNPYLLSPNP